MNKKFIHVAVGVIKNPLGEIFIAKRAAHLHQGGLWEFPGGKVEPEESIEVALARELKEELAIDVTASSPLIQIRHDYGDKAVLLDVHWVTEFSGVPEGAEGQEVSWVRPCDFSQYLFPAANLPIINAIALPTQLAISGVYTAIDDFVERAARVLAVDSLGLILRGEDMQNIASVMPLVDALKQHVRKDQFISVNTSPQCFLEVANKVPDLPLSLHLNRHWLHQLTTLEELRPSAKFIGASCHDAFELEKARELGVDYALLSPVLATPSHPEAVGLGWDLCRELIETANFPVYFLGGLNASHLSQAKQCGAQGIASISAFW